MNPVPANVSCSFSQPLLYGLLGETQPVVLQNSQPSGFFWLFLHDVLQQLPLSPVLPENQKFNPKAGEILIQP